MLDSWSYSEQSANSLAAALSMETAGDPRLDGNAMGMRACGVRGHLRKPTLVSWDRGCRLHIWSWHLRLEHRLPDSSMKTALGRK